MFYSETLSAAPLSCSFYLKDDFAKLTAFRLTFSTAPRPAGFVRARQAEVAGSPQIPDTRWQDVGGLARVKREVVDLIQLPLARPELFTGAAARSGRWCSCGYGQIRPRW